MTDKKRRDEIARKAAQEAFVRIDDEAEDAGDAERILQEVLVATLAHYTEELRAHILHTNGLLLLAAEGKAGKNELADASVAGQRLLRGD